MTHNFRIFSFVSLLIATLIALPFIPGLVSTFNSYGMVVNKAAPSFNLNTTDNKKTQLADYKGKFTYLYFGYLNCNGLCQTHLSTFFHLDKQSPEQDFRILFITMDAQRDSQEILKQRIESLGARFVALYADSTAEMQKLALAYNVPFYRTPSNQKDYEINHAGFVFLIDPSGQWRRTYTGRYLNYTKMQQDLEKLRRRGV